MTNKTKSALGKGMGALLGDGCLCVSSILISNAERDKELIERIESNLIVDHLLRCRDTGSCLEYRFVCPSKPGNDYMDAIRSLNLRVKGGQKFIPEVYKFGSIELFFHSFFLKHTHLTDYLN